MKKVLVVQPILSHYRQSLFELLAIDSIVDFTIIAGEELNGIKVFNNKSRKIKVNLKNQAFSFKGRKFYYQKGLFKAIKEENPTDIIFGGPDFHFISTILLSLYVIMCTKIRIHYWTHGTSKSNSIIAKKSLAFFYKKAASILTYEIEGKESIAKITEREKIYVLKNCLNERDYGFNNKKNVTHKRSKKFTILFSGRLTKNKRIDLLIKSIQILVNECIPVCCTIIGEGENKKELEYLTNKLNLDNSIIFTGALYGSDAEFFFQSSDVFVLPGKVGLSIVHALSYGLPIITTSEPIHSPEFCILKDKENSFLYNGQSHTELSKTLLLAYQKLKVENISYSENCIESVKINGYTPIDMYNNFVEALID